MEFNLRYPGQYFDAESKLHYNYFRGYSASQGRYTQADPIGLDGGMNRFGYVGGNAVAGFDRLGLQVEIRCRKVGAPDGKDGMATIAGVLGGEHCFVVVHCPEKGLQQVTISYLGTGVTVVPYGGHPNNDTIYSDRGQYRVLPVEPPQNVTAENLECEKCKFEQCIAQYATDLLNRKMATYGEIRGPNSNSFARHVVEVCKGTVRGEPPPTGWYATPKF
jgi:RHS repeat-associated protein